MKVFIECPTDFMSGDVLLGTPHKQVIEKEKAEALICDPSRSYTRSRLEGFPLLKVVATPSTGTNHIDMEWCRGAELRVVSLLDDRTATRNITASAEFTWLLVLESFRKMRHAERAVGLGYWRDKERELRGNELSGKRIGIVGLGRNGLRIARYAYAFEMTPWYYDPYVEEHSLGKTNSLKSLLRHSDVVVLTVSFNEETRHLINASRLAAAKKGLRLINTSRGEVVDEKEVCRLVDERKIMYYTDVVSMEHDISLLWKHDLYRLRDWVLITPHIAGATVESQTKAFQIIVNNL